MCFRTICTTIDDATDRVGLTAALDCAELWQAHLDVICTATHTFEPVTMMPDFGMHGVVETLAEDAAQHAEATLDQIEALASKVLALASSSWSTRRVQGDTATVRRGVVDACRFADLAVLTHVNHSDVENQALFGAMLSGSRVPVLLIPPGHTPRFTSAVVAWDDSPQSLAALRAALPLLKHATTVTLLMVSATGGEGLAPGAEVARMLSRHNIHAEVITRPRNGSSIADVLKSFAAEQGADLIVMGAYGHSKLRERLLGGVTMSMLRDPAVPLFLAH